MLGAVKINLPVVILIFRLSILGRGYAFYSRGFHFFNVFLFCFQKETLGLYERILGVKMDPPGSISRLV